VNFTVEQRKAREFQHFPSVQAQVKAIAVAWGKLTDEEKGKWGTRRTHPKKAVTRRGRKVKK
jgi:hypothetical protein